MANYLYVRVSSKDQNEARQMADVEKLNIPDLKVYADKQSGKDFERVEYQKMLAELKENDVIYFHSIDRMGRNYDEILENWRIITKEINADIVVLDMPLLDTTIQGSDLTGKLIKDIVLQLFSYCAERERESIRKRQAEGIKIARVDGKFRQMQATDEEFFAMKELVDKGEVTVAEACRRLGIKSRITWYNRLKIYAKDGKL
jgi:DNA invertase Pin-like site-specific DNA recombinase